ncbi:unnamed protein product, partial [Urochloa humidicola]
SLAVANYKTSSPRALTAAPLLCSTATDAAVMKPAPPAAAPVPVTKIAMPASAAVSAEAALLGKGRYKVWALAAIAVLALWSMSAASVSLRWSSSGDLAAFSGDLDVPLGEDLDSLVRTIPLLLYPRDGGEGEISGSNVGNVHTYQ